MTAVRFTARIMGIFYNTTLGCNILTFERHCEYFPLRSGGWSTKYKVSQKSLTDFKIQLKIISYQEKREAGFI
jgi:hypothetical protein